MPAMHAQTPTAAPELPPGVQPLPDGAMRFSLDGVAERERIPVFREAFGQLVLKNDFEPLADVPFDVDLRLQMLPGLMMMSGKVHGSRNQRTHECRTANRAAEVPAAHCSHPSLRSQH